VFNQGWQQDQFDRFQDAQTPLPRQTSITHFVSDRGRVPTVSVDGRALADVVRGAPNRRGALDLSQPRLRSRTARFPPGGCWLNCSMGAILSLNGPADAAGAIQVPVPGDWPSLR